VLHAVKAGETLITIAAAYGVSAETLITVNELRDPTVAKGQKLVIPPPEGLPKQVVLHKIVQTDTLLNIAAKYGSSVNDILAVNPNLIPPLLPAGQVVAVPVVFEESKPTPLPKADEETVYHTVEPGDMPLSIAYQYEIPVEMLLAANEIADPTLLQIGQQLVIPPADGVTQGVPIVLYELAEGDTLLHIATEFGSSVKDILAVNPDLNPAALTPGQTIAIPIIFAPIKPTPQPGGPARPREPVFVEASGPLVDLQQKMIALVNAEREAAGLGPYQEDPDLEVLAISHAQDMVKRGYLSHTNPDGATLRDRFAANGIGGFGHVGEDIQRNTKPRGETVETAFNWFMGSPPHRANLLHHYHNRIGVGIVEGPPGWFTFVLVFAER
jgi:LysM repeat protein